MIRILTTAILGILLSGTMNSLAQGFEGVIDFRKTNDLVESTYYRYSVKGDKVRVDEMTEDDEIVATLLVDLEKKEMLALSHERNLYMVREYKPYEVSDPNIEVTKSQNSKVILGKKCEQWRVKNKKENTVVSYWVTEGNYNFFPQLLDVLGRKDNFATYYQSVPGIENVFPMSATERDLFRNVKGKLEVVAIQEKAMDDELFELPKSYLEVHN